VYYIPWSDTVHFPDIFFSLRRNLASSSRLDSRTFVVPFPIKTYTVVWGIFFSPAGGLVSSVQQPTTGNNILRRVHRTQIRHQPVNGTARLRFVAHLFRVKIHEIWSHICFHSARACSIRTLTSVPTSGETEMYEAQHMSRRVWRKRGTSAHDGTATELRLRVLLQPPNSEVIVLGRNIPWYYCNITRFRIFDAVVIQWRLLPTRQFRIST